MKTKLLFSLILVAAVTPGALAADREGERNANARSGQLLVIPTEDPATANSLTASPIVAEDPKQVSHDYDSLMIALTQKFSAALATISEAAKRGELSGDQAREMSAEQYQVTHMQFELLSLWRGIEEQDLPRTPDVQANSDSAQENIVVAVALPFSSLQLDPSLAEYLNLTPAQVDAIQQVMMREQAVIDPLITELQLTREKIIAIDSEHINGRQVRSLANTEANLLARLIVANARMQSKIDKILSPEQQKKLNDLERTQTAVTLDRK